MTFTHATGPSHFVNAMQVHRSLWVITIVHKFWDPFRSHPPPPPPPPPPPVVTKWHDRHRYLSIHHMPYLMSLSSPRHCSKTLMEFSQCAYDAWCISDTWLLHIRKTFVSLMWYLYLLMLNKYCVNLHFPLSTVNRTLAFRTVLK